MIYYFLGIKGSGMSALAQVLVEQGHIVTGADNKDNYYTMKNLKDIKIESFKSMKLKKSYFYIIGNAYVNSNIAKYIKEMYPKSMSYSEFIAFYFKKYNITAVCGSHGKTTTTKILSTMLKKHSYIVGDGTGGGMGRSDLILEACEYKNSFLNYYPNISLILNIDYDHPDFFKSEEEYINAFKNFSNNSKIVIANGDDINVRKIINNKFITYGINENNDIVFKYKYINDKMLIQIMNEEFIIPFVGKHYAYDFIGAYIVCKMKGLTEKEIKDNIKKLHYPSRRMEIKNRGDALLICDYAHHPTEINSVYDTLKQLFPERLVTCYFQPHTISRSSCFRKEFKESLSKFDKTKILKTFTSVREKEDEQLEEEIKSFWGYECIKKEDLDYNQFSNNIYLFLGAGDIYDVFKKL